MKSVYSYHKLSPMKRKLLITLGVLTWISALSFEVWIYDLPQADAPQANVSLFDGVPVYIMSTPAAGYQVVGTVNDSGVLAGGCKTKNLVRLYKKKADRTDTPYDALLINGEGGASMIVFRE